MNSAAALAAAPWWRRLWAAIVQPSLVRRLMVAQMALLTLLWTIFLGYISYEIGHDQELLHEDHIYHTILAVADDLADQPDRQMHSLKLIDLSLSKGYGSGDPKLSPSLVLIQGGREIFRSPHAPAIDVGNLPLDRTELVSLGDRKWRLRTVQAEGSGTRAVMMVPAGGWYIFVTISMRGYYLLPLLINLPFLLLPAWLSIRLALRPWSSVAREVAARGPHALTPLVYTARHRELVAMVDSINALMQRVAESAQRERSFIADAAHELRTPLAAMRVNVEALHSQAMDERERQLLAGILSSGNRATRLVGQLLMLMRSEATDTGQDAQERVPLDELLQDRLAVLSGLAAARGVELELAAAQDVAVRGQRESLISLVDNLVENAIKYGPEGGTVRVGLALAHGGEGAPAMALLTVEDQGPGIPLPLRQRVFDRFFRDPAQTQSGSGLGLAIAQAAAARHGGRIALLDGEGGGLLVEVSLPLAV
jgi:two-component system sensor histidine kinase QseC